MTLNFFIKKGIKNVEFHVDFKSVEKSFTRNHKKLKAKKFHEHE
jgi:hypothetical protein